MVDIIYTKDMDIIYTKDYGEKICFIACDCFNEPITDEDLEAMEKTCDQLKYMSDRSMKNIVISDMNEVGEVSKAMAVVDKDYEPEDLDDPHEAMLVELLSRLRNEKRLGDG